MNIVEGARIDRAAGAVVLPDGTLLPLDGHFPDAEGPATVGIRPEHMELASGGEGSVPLAVAAVEELGADTVVHGRLGESPVEVTVRLHGTAEIRSGESVPLSIDPAQIHLFDPVSGRRVETAADT